MRNARLLALFIALAPAPLLAGPAENEAVARRAIDEVLGKGRFEVSRELFHPDYVFHADDRDYALEETEASMRDLRAAFPDLVMRVDRAVAAGDLVSIQWSGAGTNSGRAAGFPGNGRHVRFSGMAFVRFRDGLMVEEWSVHDGLALLRQLGLPIGAPPQPPAG